MDFQKAVLDIQTFLFDAGEFALVKQKGVKTSYKDGEQALTESDLAISKMAQEWFSDYLNREDCIFIDEESITQTPVEAFSSSEYQWILDPIDGTAGYALGRSMWGVSLALLYRGMPMVGGIYLPVMKELLIADEDTSWRVNPETKTREKLQSVKMDVNSQIFVESYLGANMRYSDIFPKKKIWTNTPESAIQGFFSALTNQAAGSTMITIFSIWDVAGATALARHMDYKILSMKDGREWVRFSADDFEENWKLKEGWLLTHPDNYDYIAAAIKGTKRNG